MANQPWIWRRYETLLSTNQTAKELALCGQAGNTVVLSGEQRAGRGRLGRKWLSPAGAGIYLSQLLRPENLAPADAGGVVFVSALAMAQSLCACAPVKIKWPNDIVLNGKKLVGILVESGLSGGKIDWLIVGVGVNLTNDAFPPDLPYATSLLQETGLSPAADELVASYLNHFDRCFAQWRRLGLAPVLREIAPISATLGHTVKASSPAGEIEGFAQSFRNDGALLIKTATRETVPLIAGEVSVRGLYGYV